MLKLFFLLVIVSHPSMFVCMHVREVARMHAFLDAFLVWVHGDQKGTLGGTPQYLFSFNLLI